MAAFSISTFRALRGFLHEVKTSELLTLISFAGATVVVCVSVSAWVVHHITSLSGEVRSAHKDIKSIVTRVQRIENHLRKHGRFVQIEGGKYEWVPE